jgi:uncharacterized protein (DUF433 family)
VLRDGRRGLAVWALDLALYGQVDRYARPGCTPRSAVPGMIVAGAIMRKLNQLAAKRMIGRFIVADPAICHGQPTFRGTRILVRDVLDQVASGIAWETIVEEWRGNVQSDAISEAVLLASQAFRDHSEQYTAPEYVLERAQA